MWSEVAFNVSALVTVLTFYMHQSVLAGLFVHLKNNQNANVLQCNFGILHKATSEYTKQPQSYNHWANYANVLQCVVGKPSVLALMWVLLWCTVLIDVANKGSQHATNTPPIPIEPLQYVLEAYRSTETQMIHCHNISARPLKRSCSQSPTNQSRYWRDRHNIRGWHEWELCKPGAAVKQDVSYWKI